ncbi:PTS system, beta-glucoside-specific IIABC component [Candidatus Arthromitus sp. SFB-5]|nr:PTS system, beta-glucoside-specific IIABC component [Candidatus Arthromitus sp. SFB-5]
MTPIATVQISSLGYEIVNGPGMLASNIAQGAATLAVAVKSKNSQLCQIAFSSGFTAVMGITEPALYGVNLKLKKPLIVSMIGGAIGGVYAGLSGLVRYAFVSPGIAGLPAFIEENPMNIVHAIITCLISLISAFVATCIMGFGDVEKNQYSKSHDTIEMYNKEIRYDYQAEVFSSITGEIICLSNVPDAVFSQKVMGNGIAIKPSKGKIYAPFDGEIASLFETKHAIGLISDTGIELLIYVGIDTVNLGGKFYEAHMKVGDKIKYGDLILIFDKQQIEDAGFDVITPIIITNTDKFSSIDLMENQIVSHGDKIIGVKNRE